MIPVIPFAEGEVSLDWIALTDAMAAGHTRPRAQIGDTFLYRDPDTLLSRSAWIDGLGIAVKSATIFPGNPAHDHPVVNGGVTLYSDAFGTPEAIVDFHLVTKWKTAGDSVLAARRLAPPDTSHILIVGAGTVGHSLVQAYRALFPDASFHIWNRNQERAQTMADHLGLIWEADLAKAVDAADVVSCATMTTDPLIRGDWLRPGQHIDLIGAYRPDMREADDTALQRARIFVDSYDTTLDHIGELKTPLQSGAITREAVLADYYNLEHFVRQPDDITVFKNGGGAHLDLMTARYILDCWNGADRG
ncbi:MAG: ornithine cyclodeaminase [Pseudomonadota bacterium]